MKDAVIKLADVSKYFSLDSSPVKRLINLIGNRNQKNKIKVLDNINLTIKRGEILGVVGKNGAGKSTLLKLISGVMVPSQGRIEVFGNVAAILELQSGFNPNFTGMENIYFSAVIQGIDKKELNKKVERIAEFANIGEYINQPVRTYSSGMRSKLAFSIKTEMDPDILILDEVLSVGDVSFRKQAFDRLFKLIGSGHTTVIFVSHNIQNILQICDRAIWMHEGKIVIDGSPKLATAMYLRHSHTNKPVELLKKEFLGNNESPQSDEMAPKNTTKNVKQNPSLEFYDPSLEFKTPEQIGEGGITISNTRITNENGKQVNNLLQDKKYTFQCTILSDTEYPNLRLSLAIKNEQGVVISRKYHLDKNNGICIQPSKPVQICISFRNTLNAGYYYFDFGASSVAGHHPQYVTSLADVYCIKTHVLLEGIDFEGVLNLFSTWENR